jgi:Protein of unknown function (DUF1688)
VQLKADWAPCDERECARRLVDLAVVRACALLAHATFLESKRVAPPRRVRAQTSVLLDAGAGAAWNYVEAGTGQRLGRSEGLGVRKCMSKPKSPSPAP